MAPRLIKRSQLEKNELKNFKLKKINKKIREYTNFIKNNFDDVGKDFAYEARSIYYKNKKRSKGIYGKANNREIEELRDEGIDTELIPWIEDSSN